jgi:hypothetical protein
MKPDRSNYEIWLIDWLDGNLDGEQAELLMAFLDENPDLKEEADSLAATRLLPKKNKPFQKDLFKKTPADLISSQIEYLSVAYLEDDLSSSQVKELEENLSENSENRKLFDAIQRTRLNPPVVYYKHKNLLMKETRGKRILHLTLTGLSAAAVVTILIISFIALPRFLTGENEELALTLSTDTIILQPAKILVSPENVVPGKQQQLNEINSPVLSEIPVQESHEINIAPAIPELADSVLLPVRTMEYRIVKVPDISGVEINRELPVVSLVASNISISESVDYDYGRGRISRFIASTFREKILKTGEFNDSPIKTYEIAEAGIDGLNKLLGWEMALVKTTDKDGDLKSLYFSSRVLKFNAPVRKQEPSL